MGWYHEKKDKKYRNTLPLNSTSKKNVLTLAPNLFLYIKPTSNIFGFKQYFLVEKFSFL